MTSTPVQGVLDLTFLDLRNEADLTTQITEKLTTQSPDSSTNTKSKSLTATSSMTSPGRSRKAAEIKAIRMSNNLFTKMEVLFAIPAQINAQNILWLDLSFNNFTHIPAEFSHHFPNVTTIYLQANKISRLAEIKHLGSCEQLKSLALFGNPVEERKHYRNYVLFNCKNVTQFDKSPVTRIQREKVRSSLFLSPRLCDCLLNLYMPVCLFVD
jgi:Leucine-rich repeat (LRR) protein